MKKLISFSLMSYAFLTQVACASTSSFTTLSEGKKDLFAGVKSQAKAQEPETYLLQINKETLASKKVVLPKELLHREVVAVFPSEDESVLVMTQRRVEQGDDPQFFSYNSKDSKWSKVGEVSCMTFTKITTFKNSIEVDCLKTNEAGEEVVEKKTVVIKSLNLIANKIDLPMIKTGQDKFSAQLQGDPFEWDKILVKKDNKEHVIKP
jgi:hypothetical protein